MPTHPDGATPSERSPPSGRLPVGAEQSRASDGRAGRIWRQLVVVAVTVCLLATVVSTGDNFSSQSAASSGHGEAAHDVTSRALADHGRRLVEEECRVDVRGLKRAEFVPTNESSYDMKCWVLKTRWVGCGGRTEC